MRPALCSAVFAITTTLSVPALGQSAGPAASGTASVSAGPSLEVSGAGGRVTVPVRPLWGHRNQLSLRLAVSEGYSLAIRYESPTGQGDRCNTRGDRFCPMRTPVLLDTAVGWGVLEVLEIEGRFRFGEPAFTGTVPLQAGLGIRVYGGAESPLKFVGGLAGLVDFTAPGPNVMSYRTDLQARVEGGGQYDVSRRFGFYFQVGATFGFLRSFMLAIDGGGGVQVRLP